MYSEKSWYKEVFFFCAKPNQITFFSIENYACYNHGVSQDHEAAEVRNNLKRTGGQRSACTFSSIEVLKRWADKEINQLLDYWSNWCTHYGCFRQYKVMSLKQTIRKVCCSQKFQHPTPKCHTYTIWKIVF